MIYEPPPWVDPSVLVPAPVRKSWAVIPVALLYNLAGFMFALGFFVSGLLAQTVGPRMADVGGVVLLAWFVLGGWCAKRHEIKKLAELKAAVEGSTRTGSAS